MAAWLLSDASVYVHAFLGATLTATSVGIAARVLKDIDRSQTQEARIIFGAAVIDDVLGLVILAVVSGIIASVASGGGVSFVDIAGIVGKAAGFLVGSLVLGVYLAPRVLRVASRLQSRSVLLATGLALCFLLSWLAGAIGLAPIVGAFAAGLVLEEVPRGEVGLIFANSGLGLTVAGQHVITQPVYSAVVVMVVVTTMVTPPALTRSLGRPRRDR